MIGRRLKVQQGHWRRPKSEENKESRDEALPQAWLFSPGPRDLHTMAPQTAQAAAPPAPANTPQLPHHGSWFLVRVTQPSSEMLLTTTVPLPRSINHNQTGAGTRGCCGYWSGNLLLSWTGSMVHVCVYVRTPSSSLGVCGC